MSALLLDDDDDVCCTAASPLQPCPQPKVYSLLEDDEDEAQPNVELREPPRAVGSVSRLSGTAPPTAAASTEPQREALSPLSAAAVTTVTLSTRGGNGLAKMDALVFGMPRVAMTCGGAPGSRKRAAEDASRTGPARAPGVASCGGSTGGSSSTQPKIVSAARSLSSPALRQDRPSSTTSLDTALLTPQERATPATISPSRDLQQRGSPSASPAAQPPPPPPSSPPAVSRPSSESALVASSQEPVADTSVSAVPTQPAKTQMKLSDFFSKMACKR
ncbi:hypothetical protein NESM_000023400 [Novymonas esmeraldas]|uniref:Uncharacterized protein n=1 Tax=Novymonas esmeraldas TaxID=1808958 RepID=A0AAW0F1L7_9TRYP